jgi:hypothetical protein
MARVPGSVGTLNGIVVKRAYIWCAMISPGHPWMLLWGKLRH